MNRERWTRVHALLLAAAAVVLAVEVRGALDLSRLPFAGFDTAAGHAVVRVVPRSPAERAGFAVGDRLLEDGGIDVEDGEALARRHPWARVGEERGYVVERQGEPLTLTLTFSRQPPRQVVLYVSYALVGFSFLGVGLWAFFRFPAKNTLLLALAGLAAGIGLINEPLFESRVLSRLFFSVQGVVMLFGLASFLHFLSVFPVEKKVMRRRGSSWLLYLPPAVVGLYTLGISVLQPDRDSVPYTLTAILLLVYLVTYLGLAIVAMVHSFVRASAAERTASGLRWMVFGAVAGLAPLASMLLLRLLLPRVALPAADFYAVAMILVPLSLALAVRRSHLGAARG